MAALRPGLLAAMALGVALRASAAPVHGQLYELRGSVGPYRVGMALTVGADDRIEAGHYFYASRLEDIPLSGRARGRAVTLAEPGGGVFRLDLQGDGGPGGEGISFATATGLVGAWTEAGRSLPVRLRLDWARDAVAGGRFYADVTDAPDAVFEAQVRRLLSAVLAGRKAEAAALVSYPLRVNGARPTTLRSRAALVARWRAVFTPGLLAELRQAVPHEMFVHEGRAMVADGAAWFDARGLAALNPP